MGGQARSKFASRKIGLCARRSLLCGRREAAAKSGVLLKGDEVWLARDRFDEIQVRPRGPFREAVADLLHFPGGDRVIPNLRRIETVIDIPSRPFESGAARRDEIRLSQGVSARGVSQTIAKIAELCGRYPDVAEPNDCLLRWSFGEETVEDRDVAFIKRGRGEERAAPECNGGEND
jgi:hypothetical protein